MSKFWRCVPLQQQRTVVESAENDIKYAMFVRILKNMTSFFSVWKKFRIWTKKFKCHCILEDLFLNRRLLTYEFLQFL